MSSPTTASMYGNAIANKFSGAAIFSKKGNGERKLE